METILRNCLNCNKEFNAPAREVKRGNGKFCNIKCSGAYHGKMRPELKPNTECAWCQVPLYRSVYKAAQSKSGLHFCSDEHKNLAQSIDGLKEMHLQNYGTGRNAYRDIAFKILKKPKICERCGFDKEAAITVHHKDWNHKNNDPSNLEVLCANCHAIEESKDEITKTLSFLI